MEISVRVARIAAVKTPLLALPDLGESLRDTVIASLNETMDGSIKQLAREEQFKGTLGQMLSLTGTGEVKATRIAVVGLSAQRNNPAGQVRTFGHRMGRLARDKGLPSFALVTPKLEGVESDEVARWLVEGALSGIYRYEEHMTGDRRPKKAPKRCVIVIPRDGVSGPLKVTESIRRGVSLGEATMQGVTLARDLVNTPANVLPPAALAERAVEEAEALGLSIQVLNVSENETHGMGLLEAVGRGSENSSAFVHVTYTPKDVEPKGCIALVGKGVTFDSGGLSLKTAKGQIDMKSDMGGAAVVLGSIKAAALCELPYTIHGLIPAAENMPGGKAIRPGDVFVAYNGKSVEVINTDAEGRLILADALAYATDLKPDVIIDFATLTGACLVALGPYRAGLFGRDQAWVDRMSKAARRTGELIWRLPLAGELREGLNSRVADLKNIGGSWGGSISAALFLREFVGKTPWLHLDIAGPAFLEKPRAFSPKGGTGFGVLTVLELLKE